MFAEVRCKRADRWQYLSIAIRAKMFGHSLHMPMKSFRKKKLLTSMYMCDHVPCQYKFLKENKIAVHWIPQLAHRQTEYTAHTWIRNCTRHVTYMTCELGPAQSQGLGQNIKWVGYTCYQFFIKDHRLNIHTYIHVHVCPSTTNIQDQQKLLKQCTSTISSTDSIFIYSILVRALSGLKCLEME